MTTPPSRFDWSGPVIERMVEATNSRPRLRPADPPSTEVLDDAYRACAAITGANSQTVRLGALLLPRTSRRGLHALYAFGRASDDLSDLRTVDRHEQWAQWERACLVDPPPDPVTIAWADTASRHRVPEGLAKALLDGLARDLDPVRLTDFASYADYAAGVSCPIPLMGMYIMGDPKPEAVPFAVLLGIALMLTNTLRDVGEDIRNDRVQLPLEELEAFGLSEDHLREGVVDDRWRRFMRFQIQRAREIYRSALPGIDLLPSKARFATGAISEIYLDFLDDIEAHDYDVFHRRAGISNRRKLMSLPGIWYRARRRGYAAHADARIS